MASASQSLRDPIFAELDRLIAEGPPDSEADAELDHLSVPEAIEASGVDINPKSVYTRLGYGWTLREAIYRPLLRKRRRK